MNAVPRLRLWPKSLAGQFILLALLALMAAQVVTVIVLLDERRSVLRAVAFDYVLDRTAGLHHLLSAAPDSLHDRLLESFSNPRIHFWLDDRPDLPSAPDQGPVALLADELSALTGVARTSIRVTAETRNWFHRDDHFGPRMGADTMPNHPWHRPQFSALTLALPLTDTSSAARTVWLVAQAAAPPPRRDRILAPLVSLALTGFALVIVIVFMTRRITRPLKALSQAADRFGRGQTVEPLAETGPGDLRATTASFNVMAARISRFVADRNHLLAAIAHDLRTPLTALRLQAEFVDDDETRSRILAILDDMTAMVEATLSLSREQAAEEPSRR
ncbi:MAG: HAMP domain-containing protein, partial [Rhodospirillales bacterium]